MSSQGPSSGKIRELFNSIAEDYDRLNHLLSLGIDRTWRRRALRAIVAPEVRDVLDIACGTGDFSIEIARHSPAATRITGLDLSERMLEVMEKKLEKGNLTGRISAVQGDSEHLPFADGSFDRVTIAFGIRNFEHREAALREILRVLRRGGRLVILELSVPSDKVFGTLYKAYFTKIVPLIGGWVSGDGTAYSYLPASVLKFPSKDEWMGIMAGCGYRNVKHKAFSLGICRMYTGEK